MSKRVKLKGFVRRIFIIQLLFEVLFIILGIYALKTQTALGICLMIAAGINLLILLVIYRRFRQGILREIVEFAMEYAQVQKQIVEDLTIPYGLLEPDGKVLWMNRLFREMFPKVIKYRNSIASVFDELTGKALQFDEGETEKTVYLSWEEHVFRCVLGKIDVSRLRGEGSIDMEIADASDYLLAMCLFEETEMHYLKQEVDDKNMMFGLLYIDNYDEALESIESVRRSLLAALVDRKINRFFDDYNAIIRKEEKDKYFFIMEKRYLEAASEDKFSVLEEVKTVNIGNDMAITLSIGMGVGGDTWAQNCEYARTAMDLALGRGGDQAVVKMGDSVRYYGGKTESVERNTRVKARIKAHALREIMENKDTILIMGHKIADMDALGSAIGLYRIARSLNKKAHVVLDTVNSTIRPAYERLQPENGYDDHVFVKSSEALEIVNDNTLVVIVDVNRPSYTECPELIDRAKSIVVLDHHRQSSDIIENAVLKYIEPYASSASELVAEILQYMNVEIRLKQREADAMYGGIMIDTNNFLNKTGVRTFEAAAFLRRKGADVSRVRKMFRDNMKDYKARAEAVRNAEVFQGCFAISVCPSEGIESPTVIGAQAANELLNIKGIKGSFVLTAFNNQIYYSARSIDEVNVQLIMEKLGGGGHHTMAGAQLPGANPNEVGEEILRLIEQYIKEKK